MYIQIVIKIELVLNILTYALHVTDAYQIPNYRKDIQQTTRNLVRFLFLLESNMVREHTLYC